jgi:hypothetical protein
MLFLDETLYENFSAEMEFQKNDPRKKFGG